MRIEFQPYANYQVQSDLKALEEAARLPQKLADDMLKLQDKLIRINVEENIKSSKIDTYA